MGIQFAGRSQNLNDTACLPKSDLLKVLQAGKEGRAYKDMSMLLKLDTSIMGTRIRALQGALAVLNVTVDSYKRDSAHYEAMITLITQQKDLAVSEANAWEKAYIKEKRKRFWTGVSGAVLTGAAILIKSKQ